MFYLFLGAWVLGLDILLGSPYSLDQLFSYKVWSLHPLFKLNTLNVLILPLWQSSFSSGAGGEPLRGQTLNCCLHLQLSNLFSWSLVHRTKDQAVSRLFVHGGKPHLLNDLKGLIFWSGSPSSPLGLPVVEHGTTSHTYMASSLSILSFLHSKVILHYFRWVINLVCAALMCVTGEFLCMRTELRTIPVNMAGGNTAHQQPKTDHL